MKISKRYVLFSSLWAMGLLLWSPAMPASSAGETEEKPDIRPSGEKYTFLNKSSALSGARRQVYGFTRNKEDCINLLFTQPEGGSLSFFGEGHLDIRGKDTKRISLGAGVYPFTLTEGEDKPALSGALMLYNIDKTTALATLGKSEETRLFKPELIQKAREGKLASFTVKFDDKEVLTYWLGNRKSLYPGGSPSVELDFSGTPGISKLTIGEEDVPDYRRALPVFKGGFGNSKAEYPFVMACDEREFVGYIRAMQDNEFTAFVSVPCTIPKSLLDAAAEGTVSKFMVQSQGEESNTVAEIVLSGR